MKANTNKGGHLMWTKFLQGLVGRVDARREEGQTMVEYSLILFLVSVVAIVTLGLVGTDVTGVFQDVADAIV